MVEEDGGGEVKAFVGFFNEGAEREDGKGDIEGMG